MKLREIPLNSKWAEHLNSYFDSSSAKNLEDFLHTEREQGKPIYPPKNQIFSALNFTPLSQVKVVILGQDPYHGEGQAHGLSFSVPRDQKIPPSLNNIFKELASDLDCAIPTHGCLIEWAEQGVLLLNSVLTVAKSDAGSHQKQGWEEFTDTIIQVINQHCNNVVFLLWGSHAQKKGSIIDSNKHYILQSSHPSPLSSYRGFFGCRHFSKANDFLASAGKPVINWQISQPQISLFN